MPADRGKRGLPKATDLEPANLDIALTTIDPLKHFTVYSKLPNELKLRIMKLSLSTDRIVEVRFAQSLSAELYDLVTDVPVALQVCQMWRQEAQKIYMAIKSNIPSTNNPQEVYVDFSLDLFYIRDRWDRQNGALRRWLQGQTRSFATLFPQASLIEHLIVHPWFLEENLYTPLRPGPPLSYFKNLKTVTLVVNTREVSTWNSCSCTLCLSKTPHARSATQFFAAELDDLHNYSTADPLHGSLKSQLPWLKTAVKSYRSKSELKQGFWASFDWNTPTFSYGFCTTALQHRFARSRTSKILSRVYPATPPSR